MRVIAGKARGVPLKSLDGLQTRPTLDRVKEAVFSSLHFLLPESRCLDLFAGSGALGIEALSRGAAACDFVDCSAAACAVVSQNLRQTGLEGRILQMDASQFALEFCEKYDIIFLDPPYSKEILPKLLPLLADRLEEEGCIVCETDASDPFDPACFSVWKEKRYGRVAIRILKHRKD